MIRKRSRRSAPLRGTIAVPGDKSISHRALIFSALAEGASEVANVNLGADVRATLAALRGLGASCAVDESNHKVKVQGSGLAGLHEPDAVLDAGNSGTTIRLLAGVCAGVPGLSVLTGDASLLRRPMLRVVAPLRQMGASIEGRRHGDRAPLAVRGGDLRGIDVELSVASAQVKSALLLAGLAARGTTTVEEPGVSRDHTERMLAAAGVEVSRTEGAVSVQGGAAVAAIDRVVPGDVSSAMYLIVAAVLVPGSELVVEEVGLNPTRTGALKVLKEMGADIDVEIRGETGGEPIGSVRAAYSQLRGVEIGPGGVAAYIDELPILAVAAAAAEGVTIVRGAGELRVKESDRIQTMTAALKTLGVDIAERADGFEVRGPTRLRGGEVDSAGDHRVALSLAVAGTLAEQRVRVGSWGCVATSFPEFLDVLGRAQGKPA